MAQEYVVIGLGSFGKALVEALSGLGASVLALDIDPIAVQMASDELDVIAVRADATDEAALRELEIHQMDCAVVALGVEAKEAAILTTALLAQLGVPQIVARSLGPLHSRVLRAVGAHKIVNPEEEMGRRLARQLATPAVLDRLELGEEAILAEIEAPEAFMGKTLAEIDIRRRFQVTVVALRRGEKVIAGINPQRKFRSGDVMVVLGREEAIEKLGARA